jgi:hypothetical protein
MLDAAAAGWCDTFIKERKRTRFHQPNAAIRGGLTFQPKTRIRHEADLQPLVALDWNQGGNGFPRRPLAQWGIRPGHRNATT